MGVLVVTCALPPAPGSCPEGGAGPLDFGPRCGSRWLAFWCPEYRAVAAGEARVWDFVGFEPYEEDSAILLRPQWLERMLEGVAPGEILESVVRAFGALLPILRDSGSREPLPIRTSFLVHPWPYPLMEKALGFCSQEGPSHAEGVLYWADEGIWGERGCMVGFGEARAVNRLHDTCDNAPMAMRSFGHLMDTWSVDCWVADTCCERGCERNDSRNNEPLPEADLWRVWWGACPPCDDQAEGRAAA